ncbi:MAG: hypothetical protein PCFJNLEI_02943 [Verrucomicrobiae bacterium]|nr:hypothetical protein [Verrucomicrobiae bacterium]
MRQGQHNAFREVLREVQRRMPAGQRLVQEAFSVDHHHPVFVKLNEVASDTFYVLDEFATDAFREAVIAWAARHGSGRLTVSCSAFGEFQAQRHRLQHLAGKVERIRVLAVGTAERFSGIGPGLEIFNTHGGILSRYRVALMEGQPGLLFIGQEIRQRQTEHSRCIGFFTGDPETIDEVADDIDLVVRGRARTVPSFDRLKLLHQTTQRVTRELESYSRRMDLAIRRARRRPDLLTPARFDRIVRQSIQKMEELKEIPRRALRSLGQNHW